MQGLTQPTLLLKPFAESGDKNSIPVTNSDVSNPQKADLTNGFPAITSERPENGGLPPERKDINGLGYLTTTYDFFYQAGGTFTFNATVSSAIGGYPLGARLWYTDGNGATTVLRSTKDNNTDNFVSTPSYIGTSWVQEIPVLGWNNTWTGTNTFVGSSKIKVKSPWVLGTPPSSTTYTHFEFCDNNGTNTGYVSQVYDTAGEIKTYIQARKQDGSSNYASFAIGYSSGGQQIVQASSGVKSNIAKWSMINPAGKIQIGDGSSTTSGTYTAPSNGFINIYCHDNNRTCKVYIDGVICFGDIWSSNYGSPNICFVPVGNGSVITWENTSDRMDLYFWPCIGG